MSTVKLAMIDLDATLINRQYQVTDPGIYEAIAETIAAGWTISLNSDTPLQPLEQWRKHFGTNGPIIAERGAVVEMPVGAYMDSGDVQRVASARDHLTERLLELSVTTWTGNPVEAVRAGLRMQPGAKIAVLINGFSQCSLRYHVRAVAADGSLRQDRDVFEFVYDSCKDVRPAFTEGDLRIDANPDYSMVIMSKMSDTKRLGTQKLLSWHKPMRTVMIGNSMTDYIGSDCAEHYAVANAILDFKHQSVYVAGAPMTAGVVEILNRVRLLT